MGSVSAILARMVEARHYVAAADPGIDVRVVSRTKLLYSEGPDAALDRPGHVRAASAMARFGDRVAIVQDDANFVALVDATGGVTAIPLPRGEGGQRLFDDTRGNKAAKLDLEACVVLEVGGGPCLVAFGSGSTPRREQLALVSPDGRATLFDAHAFYTNLRSVPAFAGSELNLEGATLLCVPGGVPGGLPGGGRDDVVFASRGNGAAKGAIAPIDAIGRVSATRLIAYLEGRGDAPSLRDVESFDLGRLDGARLTFTDLAAHGSRLFFVASAEASPDSVADGPVSGVAIGELGVAPRYGVVRDERGAPLLAKVEGLLVERETSPGTFALRAVVDVDDPDRPAESLELEACGFGS